MNVSLTTQIFDTFGTHNTGGAAKVRERSTATVLALWLATSKSSLPSPFTSPTTTENASPPEPYVTAVWKVPSPLPRSPATPFPLPVNRSSLPSPLTSPTVTEKALPPPEPYVTAVWKVPSPLPSSTETLFEPLLANARSSLPSPFKSPTTTTQLPLS